MLRRGCSSKDGKMASRNLGHLIVKFRSAAKVWLPTEAMKVNRLRFCGQGGIKVAEDIDIPETPAISAKRRQAASEA